MSLCECGCGQETTIRAGRSMRFVYCHRARLRQVSDRWIEEDRGYSTPCWIWQLHIMENGYGQYNLKGAQTTAHRIIYEELRGPITEGLTLDHLCRVLACVNPDHLEPVTIRENLMRSNSLSALNARKTHCDHGHEFAGENLRIARDGSRRCRTCHRDRARQRYHDRKATAA